MMLVRRQLCLTDDENGSYCTLQGEAKEMIFVVK
jgi:hypothetical protein